MNKKNVVESAGHKLLTMVEAAITIFMEFLQSGTCTYGRDPWVFTTCQEQIGGKHLVAGGFDPSSGGGLSIFEGYVKNEPTCAAAAMRFP